VQASAVLDLLENYIAFEEGKLGLVKKLAKNHQLLGVNRALRAVGDIADNNGRLGVFWHTQGSGKSLSMLFFARKVLRKKPGDWTLLIVTDRAELDDQIAGTFAACGELTKLRESVQARSREHLKELLRGNERYIFTLIQKFGTARGEVFPNFRRAATSSSSPMRRTAANTTFSPPTCARPCRTPPSSASPARR
jgi:type I restriction enzyme, R subunit